MQTERDGVMRGSCAAIGQELDCPTRPSVSPCPTKLPNMIFNYVLWRVHFISTLWISEQRDKLQTATTPGPFTKWFPFSMLTPYISNWPLASYSRNFKNVRI